MAAKCFSDGTFFVHGCSLCQIKFHFTFRFVFFRFLLLFEIICITFGCSFDKLISLVKKGFPCTLRNMLLIGLSSLEKNPVEIE